MLDLSTLTHDQRLELSGLLSELERRRRMRMLQTMFPATGPLRRELYLYGAEEGRPTADFFRMVCDACETIGFDKNDKAAQFRMLDLVVEALPDLILMPTEQPSILEVQAHRLGIEVTARAAGKTLHSEVI